MPSQTRRQAIRERIKEIITDAAAITEVSEDQIFINRYQTIDEKKLPIVVIRTLGESAQLLTSGPIQQYRRTMQLAVDIVYRADKDADLDSLTEVLAQKIETVLLLRYLDTGADSPVWNFLQYTGFDPDMQIEGDGFLSVGRLNFNCVYDTESTTDDLTEIEGFGSKESDTKYNKFMKFEVDFESEEP